MTSIMYKIHEQEHLYHSRMSETPKTDLFLVFAQAFAHTYTLISLVALVKTQRLFRRIFVSELLYICSKQKMFSQHLHRIYFHFPVTLRNVGELLEFASMYNADQLRATCQQYIAINLAALLEARYVQCRSAESHMSAVYSHQPGSLTGGKVCTTQIS